MIGRTGVAFAALALLASAAPLRAQETGANAEQAADEDAFRQMVDQAFGEQPGKTAEQLTKMIERAGGDQRARSVLLALRATAYLNAKQTAKAVRDYDESWSIDRESDLAARFRFFAGMRFEAPDQSAIALDALISRAPDSVRQIEPQLLYYYLREKRVPEAKRDAQSVELAKIGYGKPGNSDLVLGAIGTLLKAGRRAEAVELIPQVVDVRALQMAMVDRNYEALWPEFERVSGDGMATAMAEASRQMGAWLSQNTSASDRQRGMWILLGARDFDEALKIGAAVGATPAALKEIDEDGGWIVNNHALVLHSSGNAAEADRRFATLTAAAADKPWSVNMVINRVELLVQDRKYAEADRLMAYAERFTETNGSDYAKQLVRRLKLCTAIGLGRSDPALLAAVREHADDAPTATVEGLICANDLAGAEALAIKYLADEDNDESFIMALQKKPLARDDPSAWSEGWNKLRGRPALEAALAKVGRDLPDRFFQRL